MAYYIKYLRDEQGNIIYPRTVYEALFDPEGHLTDDLMRTSVEQHMKASFFLDHDPIEPMEAVTKQALDNHTNDLTLHTNNGVTFGNGETLRVTLPNFKGNDGEAIRIKLHEDLITHATLNVNDTGNTPIVYPNGKLIKRGPKKDSYLTLIYNGENFIVQGERGVATGSEMREQISTFHKLMTNTMNVRGWW